MPHPKPVARSKTKAEPVLNPKQARFVMEYMVDMNATAAYIRAGYSPKAAEVNASRMIRFDKVAKAIKKAQDATAAKIEVTRDQWLAELKIVGFSDIKNHVDIDSDTGSIRAKAIEDMPADSTRAIESITEVRSIHESARGDQTVVNSRVTFRFHSKLDALITIGKHCGYLKAGKIEIPGVEKALYELSEKFLPVVAPSPSRGHDPK